MLRNLIVPLMLAAFLTLPSAAQTVIQCYQPNDGTVTIRVKGAALPACTVVVPVNRFMGPGLKAIAIANAINACPGGNYRATAVATGKVNIWDAQNWNVEAKVTDRSGERDDATGQGMFVVNGDNYVIQTSSGTSYGGGPAVVEIGTDQYIAQINPPAGVSGAAIMQAVFQQLTQNGVGNVSVQNGELFFTICYPHHVVWRVDDTGLQSSFTVTPGAAVTALAPPTPGTSVPLAFCSDPGRSYYTGSSFGSTPGIVLADSRVIPLNVDALLLITLGNMLPAIFSNFAGILDSNGQATGSINLPLEPGLVGLTFYTAFVTIDTTAPSGIRNISPALPLRISP